jgi:uridine kinase
MSRKQVLRHVADMARSIVKDSPVLVAVDGPDGSGKTVLAAELAAILRDDGATVERISLDDFHRPASERYARGRDSAEGFYRDSFDLELFRRVVLDPLGAKGDRRFVRAAFDHTADLALPQPIELAAPYAIVVIDGLFLHVAGLREAWDLSLFVMASEEERLRRMLARDGDEPDARRRFWKRYAAGQRLYLADVHPLDLADILIDNEVIQQPRIIGAAAGHARAMFR